RERVDGRGWAEDDLAQRRIDQPVAFDRTLARERPRHDRGREMVAPAGRIDHVDDGVGERLADAGADIVGRHGANGIARYNRGRIMKLGTRVTVVTTLAIGGVLAVSGYAALKVRRANLEADLGREAHEMAAALRAGIEPIEALPEAATETL